MPKLDGETLGTVFQMVCTSLESSRQRSHGVIIAFYGNLEIAMGPAFSHIRANRVCLILRLAYYECRPEHDGR
jgi:hypothetical protein